MQTDDIDKIIAEALNEGKQKESKWHRPKHDKRNTDRARRILNAAFMLGFVAAIAIYFLLPEQRVLFFCVGFGALILKIVEFVLRFMF